MAQDLTKFTIVLVLFGLVLAIAIFRPQVLPSLSNDPNPGSEGGEERTLSYEDLLVWQGNLERRQRELDQREAELAERETTLNQRQADLEDREAALNQRQAEINEREGGLNQRQIELDRRETALNQRQADLDDREAALNQRQVELDERDAALKAWWSSLQEVEARLREKETNLAEQEQRVQGLLRWSVVAMVVSSLMAIPSVLVLIALMREGRRTPNKEVQRDGASNGDHRKRRTQHGRMTTSASALVYSDNGRTRVSCF